MREALARRTLQLVDVASPSRHEAELEALVASEVPLEPTHRDDLTLLYEAPRTGRPLVLLAGHLDTVPPQGNLPGRLDEDVVHGLGAADMKAGLAVMIELARWVAAEQPALAVDLAFLFFPREELPAVESALPAFLDDRARGRSGARGRARADGERDPGRLPRSHLRHPRLRGPERALGAALARRQRDRPRRSGAVPARRSWPPRDVELSGLVFREVLSVTQLHAGIAGNVLPARAEATLSYRYAPDRTSEEAEAELRRLVGDAGRLEGLANSPAARVVVDTRSRGSSARPAASPWSRSRRGRPWPSSPRTGSTP